jgi:hypothetical protein
LGALLAIAVAAGLPAQADVAARLSGRVSPEVAAAVGQLADSAARQGLPVEPLVEKAIEGGAKGVPAARVLAAVRSLVARLGEAATAVRAAGATANAEVVEAGAFALNAGLDRREVESLVRRSRPPYLPAATLRVAGTLAALGVPPGETADVVQQAIDAGTSPGDLLDLPQRVEKGVAHGASPGNAAAGLGRGQASAPGLAKPHESQGQGKGQSHKP